MAERKRRRADTTDSTDNAPRQAFGPTEASNAVVGNQFHGPANINFYGESNSEALDSIKTDTLHIRDNLDEQKVEERSDAELRDFLASLYFPSMNARRNMSSIVGSEGTFQWVLDTSSQSDPGAATDDMLSDRTRTARKFSLWLRDPGQRIFWISGKPGSGKSTLMRHLAGMPETVHAATGAHPDTIPIMLSAFIWASGDKLQRSLKCLLCTLLYQLFSQNSVSAKATLSDQSSSFNMKKTTIHDWSEAELRKTLARAIRSLPQPIYIFIDGLDEIDPVDGTPERLLDFVRSVLTHNNVKLCVSSRPEVFFERSLQHYPHFRLQDLTWDDMSLYVRQKLAGDLLLMPESAERRHNSEAVMKHLVDHAEGVFLWLQLVITSLKTGITNDDSWELLWGRIDDLPVDLESFYEKLVHKLERENKKYREFAATVFALLLLNTHYSTGSSYGPALGMDWASSIDLYFNKDLQRRLIEEKVDDPLEKKWFNVSRVCRQLRARCAGLVQADWGEERSKGDTRVSFIHRTVHDFMLESGHGLWAQAVLLDLNTCLDVQHAELQRIYPGRITLVGLWALTLTFHTEWDVTLLEWCSRIPEGFPGEPREAAFEHLARAMTAKGIWSRDERNPCVLALLHVDEDYILPPRRWLEDWAPTGMSSADFKDHLLLVVLAAPVPGSPVAVRWLCDNGATPYRRGLEQWPGTNWPSAHALAIGAYAGLSRLRVLQTMMQLGVDLEEQLTVLSHDKCWIIAFNRHTTSLQHKTKTTHYLPLMQMRIPAFLRLALGNTKLGSESVAELDEELDNESVAEPDEEILMHFAKEILRHHGTIESSIQLLGFVCTDFVPTKDTRSVALPTGSYKLGHELTLRPGLPTLAAAQQALEEFHAQVEAIKQASMQDCSLPWMDSQATMDWLAASGFAEDKRDPY